MQTIVFSDIHGEPDIVRGVVEHSGYVAGDDRLVFAGDAVDIGRDDGGCIELLEELGAEFLVGNHELMVYEGWEFEAIDVHVAAKIRRRINDGDWVLAAEADGVLITHAGLSAAWAGEFQNAGGGDVARFAGALNDEFRGAILMGELVPEGVLDVEGPLWWRPGRGEPGLPGVVQVLGHTPPEMLGRQAAVDALAEARFYLIDPNVRAWKARGFGAPMPVRYAVIERGAVLVVEAGGVG